MAAGPSSGSGSGSGSGAATAGITDRLLAHYHATRRDLPWRQDTDPYRVWVSEVMLQQTRVETVVPYYRRWLERFPSLAALADASGDEVLKQWEGLGYYSRARNLHRAARVIRERHAGHMPSDPQLLRDLPGFGDYTVGAVASIAFGHPLPAVDGNVRRVVARLFDVAAPPAAWLRETAAALVPTDAPGDFNQALMELGATICTPRHPRCDACPVTDQCLAHARGTTAERPGPRAKTAVRTAEIATAVLRDGSGRLLLLRNGDSGLLAGLWGFPVAEVGSGETAPQAAARAAHAAGADVAAATGRELDAVRHEFSHLRAVYRPVLFDLPGPEDRGADGRWIAPGETNDVAMSIAHQKIRRLAEAAGGPGR